MGHKFFKNIVGIWLVTLMLGMVVLGCARPAEAPEKPTASLTVSPSSVELSMAMVKQKITFTGTGFAPGDRVSIVLVSAWEGKDVDIATATADENGTFTTEIPTTTKMMEILHIVAPGWPPPFPEGTPPLAPGVYTAKAISWDSDAVATCEFELKAPAE